MRSDLGAWASRGRWRSTRLSSRSRRVRIGTAMPLSPRAVEASRANASTEGAGWLSRRCASPGDSSEEEEQENSIMVAGERSEPGCFWICGAR